MSDKINNMDFKHLRNEVQSLRDELAIMKRKYEDIIYNLDTDNFSSRFVKEKGDMKTAIEVNAEGIKTKVSNEEFQSAITQTAKTIETEVKNLVDADIELSSKITQTANEISAIVSGDYTDSMLEGYLTGIVISPNSIKMVDGDVYSIYNSDGLRFYDSSNQVEGWAIEPSDTYGGVLNYYVNDGNCYRFGAGESGTGYSSTDMSIKAINSQRDRFVVDVTNSGNPEVKFVGLNYYSANAPYIYANEKLLATQEWVLENAGSGSGGTVVAVFG